jgi:hypothetical protein
MTARKLHAAWLAGVSGAVFPLLLVAAWAATSALWRPPMARVTAFLDPPSVHRALGASAIVFDAGLGALIGLGISLLIARMARDERWFACIIFLSAFAAACMIPAALREGWIRTPNVLAQPLLFGFVAAVIAGVWLAPRIAAPRKSGPGSSG